MKHIKLTILISNIEKNVVECNVSSGDKCVLTSYFHNKNEMVFSEKNELSRTILEYRFQFRKVLNSAIKGTLKIGQTINCVFIKDFNFLSEDKYNLFIRVDRRSDELIITTSQTGTNNTYKIYSDGSHKDETGHSGYAGFTESPDGVQEIYNQSFEQGNSNLMELLAVTEGLKRLENVEQIQVNTDSRFVIRGLAQWVHFWRLNNWQTAYGCDVKFVKEWQEIDHLCKGKLIEFKWIKGHSGHQEQDFCHRLAKESCKAP